jgi:hypothetical protein
MVRFALLLAACAFLSAGVLLAQAPASAGLLARIDHLVYATPDLQAAVDGFERLTGVRATPGGQHPGRGTRNALVALGGSSYLEIIGPDPEQAPPASPRPFGIDGLTTPRLVTWAAKGTDLDAIVAAAAAKGIRLGAVGDGKRQRPDGVVLTWRYSDPKTVLADGIVPFFIDWGKTPHPSQTAAPGVRLLALRAEHPDAARVQAMLRSLGLDLPVKQGPAPALSATLETPKGHVELR